MLKVSVLIMIFIYIQLFLCKTQAMTQACQSEILKIYSSQSSSSLSVYYNQMYQYSGLVINALGNYDSCKAIEQAKYVVFSYNFSNPAKVFTLCGPSVCTEDDYYDLSGTPIKIEENYEVIFPASYQEEKYGTLDTGPIVMLGFIGVIILLVIIASVLDYFLDPELKSKKGYQYVLSFSVISNGKELLAKRKNRQGEKDTLEILNGIKVLSILFIIFFHTVAAFSSIAALNNYNTLYEVYSTPIYILYHESLYAVDFFF